MAVNIGIRQWVTQHPWVSAFVWLFGLLLLAGGYFGLGAAIQIPVALERSVPQEAVTLWARPHIERCAAGAGANVSEAKAEEILRCSTSVVEIASLGHRAMAVLDDNPAIVIKAHLAYRGSEEWKQVLRLGDNRIAPVLKRCFEGGGDSLFDANSSFGKSVRGLFQGKAPSFDHQTSEQCGWYAVQLIAQTGTDFLSQFGVKDGEASRLPSRTLGAFGIRTLFGSTLDVEKKLVMKEEIPPSQWAWSAVEVATTLLALKPLFAFKAAAVAGSGTKLAAGAAGIAAGTLKVGVSALAIPVVKVAAVGGLAYYAVTNPGDVTHGLGQLAGLFGLSPLVFQIGGWAAIVVTMMAGITWLLTPILLLVSTSVRVASRKPKTPKRT